MRVKNHPQASSREPRLASTPAIQPVVPVWGRAAASGVVSCTAGFWGLCGGGSFRVGSLSRGVGCGGSFGAVGVVRVSRGFRGGGVCVGVRCQRDLFHRQNRQF